jgi:3-hydroxyacyl-CoA dehydrogenase
MVLGCAHPMGPLRLLDLIGLDTAQSVAESMYEEFKEPLYAPPPLLRRMLAAGTLGCKTAHSSSASGNPHSDCAGRPSARSDSSPRCRAARALDQAQTSRHETSIRSPAPHWCQASEP